MPSRSPRSRSRSPSTSYKKTHKQSQKSNDRDSSLSSNVSNKKEEITNDNENNSLNKSQLPSMMLPSSFPAKMESQEEEIAIKTPTGNESPADSISSNTQIKKQRKRRWIGDETVKVVLPNMPTTISTTNMTEEQQKIYILQLQIEELTRRLKMNDLHISSNPGNRSPSPEPIYDQQGKRQNTREVRTRRKIEDQRHQFITELIALNPDYKPPGDYKPQQLKYTDKVMIPQEDHPDVNFVGLIIGPRGNTLKMLEKETNAKIIIRGKGSVKDGKMGLVKHAPLPGEDEPLHAYITGNSSEIVAKAVEKVQEIINKSIDAPEGLNELRKQQLRQLALLNGTLRENDCLMKLNLMNEAEKIVTNTIICTVCGGAGHLTTDCKFRKKPDGTFTELNSDGPLATNGNRQEQQKLDCEYQSLMNELMGKKNTNTLSLDDQRSLMTGSKTTGSALAITGGTYSSITDDNRTVTTVGSVSFNSNGSMNTNCNYNPPSLMSLNQNNNNNHLTNNPLSHSNTSFNSTGTRYNNNDVFDGYHLLRGTNRNNNYSSYIERDSYRAQHIPALMINGGNSSHNTSSISWQNSQQQQQQQQQQQNYSNQQQWNQYNAAMYYQNVYQQQYYQNNNLAFTPPLPRAPPPPPPPL
ncbi:unnamed protein product [Rotaria sordida]|uniref:Branchpoint-bridging protein n=1 Tax=Rotaria sordida TaxID=392033 RepID=A0A813SVP5_9BILA|nr:unnamed protein product [Rotaria sordida]CAF0856802.1 unnamed protein product [Rotaria sordida]CAF3776862.1 unnamed protein product [Rotaria sordida]